MPIQGLSERRRFTRGGKLRLGEKRTSQNGKEYPSKLDYFLFDPEDESMGAIFESLYGPQPRKLTIAFPSEDLESVFPQYYKAYGSSGLVCKGDGVKANRTAENGELVEVECPGPEHCEFARSRGRAGNSGCKQVASLQFFLPDLPVMSTWQIDTTSFNSIVNVNSALDLMRNVCGRISFVPVELQLKQQQATNPDTKKAVTIYVLDIVLPVGLRQITTLKPLLAYAGAQCPAPIEALPDDLYPAASGVAALPAPDEPDEPEPMVNIEGEIIEDSPFGDSEPDAVPCGFGSDPEIQALLKLMPEAKAQAMLFSADENGWSRDEFIALLKKHTAGKSDTWGVKTAPAKSGRLF